MAVRFSGNVVIRLSYKDYDGQYHCGLSWPGGHKRIIVGHPVHLTMAVDSSRAYDQAARTALAFAENEGTDGDFRPAYGEHGFDVRRDLANPFNGFSDLSGYNLADPSEIERYFGTTRNGAEEIATRLSRAAHAHDDPERTLRNTERMLRAYGSKTLFFGIETIRDPRRSFHGPHGQVVCYYINTGDTYAATILFDVTTHMYAVGTWGDWLEEYENENGSIES